MPTNAEQPDFVPVPTWVLASLGGPVIALVALAACDPLRRLVARVLPGLTRSRVRGLAAVTLLAHLAEASAAVRTARAKGIDPVPWAAQTALVGFPSLLALHQVEGRKAVEH